MEHGDHGRLLLPLDRRRPSRARLALLVGVPSLPWWVFSAVVILVYVLIAPIAATGQALLYGNAVAGERDRAVAPDLVDA